MVPLPSGQPSHVQPFWITAPIWEVSQDSKCNIEERKIESDIVSISLKLLILATLGEALFISLLF